jgi:hypothetical protein
MKKGNRVQYIHRDYVSPVLGTITSIARGIIIVLWDDGVTGSFSMTENITFLRKVG